jgi:uncharacterized metal-binding protein YceD (DUF177 family)
VKKSANEFIIHFIGLKIGTHRYEFNIDKTFFEGNENTLIEDANLKISLALEKKETMMVAHFELDGTLTTTCDRCNDPIALPVEADYKLIFKFGTEVTDDETLIMLDPDAYEIDFTGIFAELMIISLPLRVIHPEGQCNPEVMELYKSLIVNANEPDEDWEDDWEEDEDQDWDDADEDDWDNDADDTDSDDIGPEDDKPIDPRWSVLKNLN